MKTIEFDQLDETLYYEKLDNGLDVYILPKKASLKHLSLLLQNMVPSIVHSYRLVKLKQLQSQMVLHIF